jgi:hypothetical protein
MSAAILTSIILSLLTVVLFYQAQKKITIPVTQKGFSCGKIGFLPNRHMHVSTRGSSANLFEDVNCWCHLSLTQTCFEGQQEEEWIF